MTRPRIPTLLIGSLILGVAAVMAAWPDPEPDAATRPEVAAAERRPVRTARVGSTGSARTVQLPGVIRAVERATLAFTVPARITTQRVEVGDRVEAGQLVTSLDDREYRLAEQTAAASLAEIEVRLAQARRDEQRVARLVDVKAATTEELEQVRAAAEALGAARQAASAGLEEARRLLEESRLVAPFAATVTAVHLEAGEWAAPGAAVVELAGAGPVEVQVDAPAPVRGGIAVGSRVAGRLSMLGVEVSGTVVSVAGAAADGGLFPVLIRLHAAGPEAAPGTAVELQVPLATPERLTVPLAAVVDAGSSRPAVFRIADGRAERIELVPGEVIGDRIAVRSSTLAAGDLVAVVGHTALVDGDPVEVF